MRPNLTGRIHTLLLVVIMACASTPETASPTVPFDVQGHRGARGLLPENTLEAFELALELGVSTLELDLGVTRDRQVVVSHERRVNPQICRQADGSAISDPPLLRQIGLDELRTFDCGLNPDRQRFPEPPRKNLGGARIPTLAEVFDLAGQVGDEEVRFNIEIKLDPTVDDTVPIEQFVELVVGVVHEHGMGSRVTIQSFAWEALERVQGLDPALQTAALLAPDTLASQWLNGLDPKENGGSSLALLRAASSYVDVFSPYWRQVVPGDPAYFGSTVAEIQAAGFPVIPWTVNQRRQMEGVLALGVDGLITDYPDVLIDLLREKQIPIR